jgi:hypothetical protein
MSLLLLLDGVGAVNYILSGSAGSYIVTGQSATVIFGINLAGQTGTYAYTGQTALVSRLVKLAGNTGSYSYSGNTATVGRLVNLAGSFGAYAYSGQPATATYTSGSGAIAYSLAGLPGSYAINGQSATVTLTQLSMDGGGGRKYWQPYWIEKQDWEKKIPPVAVQTIERIARSKKDSDAAELALMAELEDYQARYGVMLQMLRQNQLNSLAILKKQQLAQIQAIQDEEDAEILLLFS